MQPDLPAERASVDDVGQHQRAAQFSQALLLSLAAALAAALYPAWRSARLPLAASLREE